MIAYLLWLVYIPLLLIGIVLLIYYPLRMVSIMISSHYGAPFVPLPKDLISRMFEVAELSAADLVYDLGSGDGRVLISAYEGFQAKGIGYEVAWYPLLLSWKNLHKKNYADKITIERADFFKKDVSKADVVVIYQEPAIIDRLVPKLERELSDKAMVISPRFEVKAWEPSLIDNQSKYPVYFYKMGEVRDKPDSRKQNR